MVNYLGQVFTGRVEWGGMEDFTETLPITQSITNWMNTFFNNFNATFDSVNASVANLATAMTAQVRQNGDKYDFYNGSGSSARGSVIIEQTCISVQWAWFALPASLLALTILFLVAIIIQTSSGGRSGAPWKSSSLPLVLSSLDSRAREEYETTGRDHEMEKVAETLRVKLGESDKLEWVFGGDGEAVELKRNVGYTTASKTD